MHEKLGGTPRVDKGSLKKARTTRGLAAEAAAKKQTNVTVTPSGIVEDFTNVEGVQVDLLGGEQVGYVHVEVLEPTVRPEHQTVGGKAGEPNRTIIPTSKAIVNPSLGSIYKI